MVVETKARPQENGFLRDLQRTWLESSSLSMSNKLKYQLKKKNYNLLDPCSYHLKTVQMSFPKERGEGILSNESEASIQNGLPGKLY